MSLKAELETWAAALKAYDEEDFETALELFSRIADTSKILTNMGLIYATLGEHQAAIERFMEATQLDQFLAVAYFQCGVSRFLLEQFDGALNDFEQALLYLRGNQAINYEQLGLKFRLFSAEVHFNIGLSKIYMGDVAAGLQDMEEARNDKATEEHSVIDDAIKDRGDGYTVFSIPVGILYRPSEKKLKNSTQRDYMGKAKLVATSDASDSITTFSGVSRLKQGMTPAGLKLDRPDLLDTAPASTLLRSATVPPVMPTYQSYEGPRSAGVERSRTVGGNPSMSSNLRDGPKPPSPQSAQGPGIKRSNTQIVPGRPSAANAGLNLPVRGLSIRRPANSPASPNALPPPPKEERMTEFYDEYIDSYAAPPEQSPQPLRSGGSSGSDRIGTWARNNATLQRAGSRSAPSSNYAPSSYGGGGSMRRKSTRRGDPRRSRIQSTYEEEEEGYGSGDYDDGPWELSLIRVKLHFEDDIRGMTLPPDVAFNEFVDKVAAKFGRSMKLKFTDEDGGKVTLRDDSDFELAIETARENSKGRSEGKLEVWCTD